MKTILKCEVCKEEIPLGEGAMDRADNHEYKATMLDPESRDHLVSFIQVKEDDE